jgi:hypothetical protein
VQKLSSGTVTNHLCALRFFYIQTLKKRWSFADTPYPKKRHRLPTILSQEAVAQLIDAAPTAFYRTLLMTLSYHHGRYDKSCYPRSSEVRVIRPEADVRSSPSINLQPAAASICANEPARISPQNNVDISCRTTASTTPYMLRQYRISGTAILPSTA